MSIKISQEAYEGLEAVRQSGVTHLLDRKAVQYWAYQWEYFATVLWIEDNPSEYARGIFQGFEVEGE